MVSSYGIRLISCDIINNIKYSKLTETNLVTLLLRRCSGCCSATWWQWWCRGVGAVVVIFVPHCIRIINLAIFWTSHVSRCVHCVVHCLHERTYNNKKNVTRQVWEKKEEGFMTIPSPPLACPTATLSTRLRSYENKYIKRKEKRGGFDLTTKPLVWLNQRMLLSSRCLRLLFVCINRTHSPAGAPHTKK